MEHVRFRPASHNDFSRYARNLSWLLQEPLQKCQELLAQIYGYSNLHELHAVLELPGHGGPFDDEFEPGTDRDRLGRARDKRLLDLVCQAKRRGLAQLDPRHWLARELGLFCTPREHRARVRQLRARYALLDGPPPAHPVALHDYIEVIPDPGRGRCLALTQLCRDVLDAAKSLLPDPL